MFGFAIVKENISILSKTLTKYSKIFMNTKYILSKNGNINVNNPSGNIIIDISGINIIFISGDKKLILKK